MALTVGTKESYIGAFFEDILYGAYILVFLETFSILWARRKTDAKYIYLWVTTVLMATLITARCVIDTFRCVIALENNGVDFGPPNTNTNVAANACWFLLVAVTDAFIIFRTFIVWNRNWLVIIIPSMLYLACYGITIWILLLLKGFDPERGSIFQTLILKNVFVVIALTLATNLTCTGLISFRLFSKYRQIAALSSSVAGHSMKIFPILVESATLYSLFLIGILILAGLKSYVVYILIDCISPITGLVFSYIIIRVGRGTSYSEASQSLPTMSFNRGQSNTQTFELSDSAGNPPPELQVRLQRITHQHSDPALGADIQVGESKEAKYGEATLV
ncbi:hypothetical protein B0H11DRAFT_2423486 [Mycena galericulata]|nr:hypothetical protein B0H11DRAFT_2423486 [Mycena galericulata]